MIESRSNELEGFKRDINLTEFVTKYGFLKDVKKSTKKTVAMRDPSDYLILISISKGGHWQYFSPHDDTDHGTIIDFVKKNSNCNLGHVRKILRDWVGHAPVPDHQWQQSVKTVVKDRKRIVNYLKRFSVLSSSQYLSSRGVTSDTLNYGLFKNKILQGYNGAVIFPHYDEKGICGYEVKNEGFTNFSENGFKSLWISNKHEGCKKIVFVENPIEALSYYQIFPDDDYYFFVSPCGNWSPIVSDLIQQLMKKNNTCCFVSAFNNDKGGERQHNLLNKLLNQALNKELERVVPITEGNDWNNCLMSQMGAPI